DQSTGGEYRCYDSGGALTDFFALGREDIVNGIVRNQLAPCTGDNSRNDFFLYRLRQVRLDVIEMLRIEAIAHRNRQPKRESFFGLDIQWLGFVSNGLRIL